MTPVAFLESGDHYRCKRGGVFVKPWNKRIISSGGNTLTATGLKEVLSIQHASLKHHDYH